MIARILSLMFFTALIVAGMALAMYAGMIAIEALP